MLPSISEFYMLKSYDLNYSGVVRTVCTERRLISLGRSGGVGAFWRKFLDPKRYYLVVPSSVDALSARPPVISHPPDLASSTS